MSGYQAYASFVNFMKTALTGSGINVLTEKASPENIPYLLFQQGPERVKKEWLSSVLCQAWLVVSKNDIEPLEVTLGKAMDKIISACRDKGHIYKYDYSVEPSKVVGTVIPHFFEITGDMSDVPLQAAKVITWDLHSANK